MHAVNSRFRKVLIGTTSAAALCLALSSCSGGQPADDAQHKESTNRQSGFEKMVTNQPGKTMSYSPTRETINFWVETWDEPGKLSYVYMQNAEGKITGYFVLKGLPVSYCAAISPTYKFERHDTGEFDGDFMVPAPANDGAYYSGGGQCNTFYGKDASSGAYIEYTAGMGINILLYDQPLPPQTAGDALPLGPTTAKDAAKLKK